MSRLAQRLNHAAQTTSIYHEKEQTKCIATAIRAEKGLRNHIFSMNKYTNEMDDIMKECDFYPEMTDSRRSPRKSI